jgi:5,10-methylene-tetrahydrofolate dehydrogenase/methenyl tetrahydrofolate cyclohydrolase
MSSSTTTTSSKVIDGQQWAEKIRQEIKQELEQIQSQHSEIEGLKPGIAVVLVGDRKDSATYVRMKRRVAAELGFHSLEANLPQDISEEDLVQVIRQYNESDQVHGILIQLPLPSHINEERILNEVSLDKDVDGFHAVNIGKLAMKGRTPTFIPCTPKGCLELLDREGVKIDGSNAVVVGRSNIVGVPMAMLLLHRNATVTICHSKTKDIADMLQRADIIVAACGQPLYVKKEWVKPGAVIIDVGINAVDDATKKVGYRLVGDVDYDNVIEVASKITPVPRGVGPMTIAMLMKNTFDSFKRHHGL